MTRMLLAFCVASALAELGCRACKKQEPEASSSVLQSADQTQQVPPAEKAEPVVASYPDLEKERPIVRMARLPASYFGLDVRSHALLRISTTRLGEARTVESGHEEVQGLSLAYVREYEGIDKTAPDPSKLADEVYTHLIEQKILTLAKPLLVVWNISQRSGAIRWSVAVPVTENSEPKEPVQVRHVPRLHAKVFRGKAKEIFEKYLPNLSNENFWHVLAGLERNVGFKSEFLLIRFSDFDKSPAGEESEIELILGTAARVTEGKD